MTSISPADSQIAAFLERQPVGATVEDSEAPRVIFKGELELTREQEDSMVAWVQQGLQSLDLEFGRDDAIITGESGSTPPIGTRMEIDHLKHIPRRELWELVYAQRMDWRRDVVGGIFGEGQNIHFPMTKRIVNQMISRAQNYFFQTEPWFNPGAIGAEDPQTAKTANEWAQYRFDQAKVRAAMERAVEKAFIRGECVVTAQQVEKSEYYEETAEIMVTEEGEAVIALDGDYVFGGDEPDEWVDPTGESGVMVLKREIAAYQQQMPVTSNTGIFEMQKIRRKIVHFSGPQAAPIALRDFVATMDAESLQDVSLCCHYYDMTAIDIVGEWIKRMEARGVFDPEEYPRVMDFLTTAAGGSRQPTTGHEVPKSEVGEAFSHGEGDAQRGDPRVRIAKTCFTMDVNQDGVAENVFMLLDLDTGRPILYDYVAVAFLDQRRPFHRIRINPIEGRWTGVSAVEIFWQLQRLIDLNINRWDMSLSSSGTVTFWHPELTVEGQSNPNLKLNCGKTYRKKDARMEGKHIVERVALYEFKGAQMETLLQYYLQIATNMSGTANANDSQMAGLDSSKLATGIRNLDRSGHEQFAPLLSHLSEGITEASECCMVLCVKTMDDEEAFEVTGPDGLLVLKTLKAESVRKIKWRLTLELTRYKAEQEVAESQGARVALSEWISTYVQFGPEAMRAAIPFYEPDIKARGVRDAKEHMENIIAAMFSGAPAQSPAITMGEGSAPGMSPTLT